MEKKGVRSEGRGLRRTLIAVLGTITLATAPSGPLMGQTSSAVPGQWLYLPLSKIGRDVNGFHGYNIVSGLCGTHYAEDLTGTQGDPVLAAADGNVLYAGPANDGTGLYFVTLTHTNGYTTKYYHLQHMTSLSKGQYVPRGTKVGEIYSPLGGYSHVHFSVRSGTDNVNGCTLSNTTGGCLVPGDPPGMSKSSSCFGDGDGDEERDSGRVHDQQPGVQLQHRRYLCLSSVAQLGVQLRRVLRRYRVLHQHHLQSV